MASLYGTGVGVSLSGLQNNSFNDITADNATITTLNSTTITTTTLNATNLTGTIQTASQPNITSLGIQSSGLTIGPSQFYKINVGPMATYNLLGFDTLGSTVVNSSLTSFGIVPTATITTLTSTDVNSTNLTGTLLTTTQPLRNIVPSTNQLYIGDVATNTYIEITPTTAIIDFISSGVGSTDYNGRIRCTGGTATAGSGTMTHTATAHNFVGQVNSTTGRIISSANVSDAFFHNIAVAQTYTKSFTALNSAMTNGQNVQISFGKAQSTNNCVEIGHAYDGTTPANNKCTFGFYGNGPIMSYNQSGTITMNNFNIKPNTKEDATVSNSTQLGSVATQTTLANITFTTNSQSSYVCSASSNNSTAFRAFGTSASNWASTSNIYNATGVYTGTANIVSANGTVVYGEYIQIQLPTAYVLKGASWTNTPDSNPSRALTYNIYGSSSGSSGTWYIIHQGTTGGSSTTTVSNFDMISQFTYFVLQIKSMTDGGTGFDATLNLDALTITAFNYTELVYSPQSLEIGDSTTASIPNDTLTVNGTSRLKGIVVSEDYTTLNGAVDGNANFSLTGFLYKYKKICAKVSVSNATAFTANTSFWASTRSPSITYDNTFTSGGVPTGYGMIITAGTYNGMYRAFYAGIYKVCINGRCADTTATNIGVMPKTYNGTTFVNIFPDDGVVWIAPESTNRRSFNFAFDISLASGTAVFLTVFAGNNQNWATMSVEFVSST